MCEENRDTLLAEMKAISMQNIEITKANSAIDSIDSRIGWLCERVADLVQDLKKCEESLAKEVMARREIGPRRAQIDATELARRLTRPIVVEDGEIIGRPE